MPAPPTHPHPVPLYYPCTEDGDCLDHVTLMTSANKTPKMWLSSHHHPPLHESLLRPSSTASYSFPPVPHLSGPPHYLPSICAASSSPPSSNMPDHLPTPTLTPTQDSFALSDARRPLSQYMDNKQTALAGRHHRQTNSNHSVAGHDLPVTPQTNNSDDMDHYQTSPGNTQLDPLANGWDNEGFNNAAADTSAGIRHAPNIPKLDRTMSDIFQDELYNPSFGAPQPQPQPGHLVYSTSYLQPHHQHQLPQQPQQPYQALHHQHQHHPTMAAALHAAQQAHQSSPHPDHARDISPFRQDSLYASERSPYQGHLPSAAANRQQQRQMASQQALYQYRARREDSQPKTISPKDAILDYNDSRNPSSLFPEAQSAQQSTSSMYAHQNNSLQQQQYQPPSSSFNFSTAGMPVTAPNAEQRFMPPHFQAHSSNDSVQSQTMELPTHFVSMESSHSEASSSGGGGTGEDDADEDDDDDDDDDDDEQIEEESVFEPSFDNQHHVQRPANTLSDSGTYTCTYHGCKERFTSPALLQKHKREDHRSTAPSHHQHADSPGSSSATAMTQAGPHRCDRINPQTGKSCNTVFSRPYDLTRHEDTIHNRVKAKVRCHLCTEEKTFSRNDALTRHMKVVHPTVPWPSKQKRRGH